MGRLHDVDCAYVCLVSVACVLGCLCFIVIDWLEWAWFDLGCLVVFELDGILCVLLLL